MSKSARAWWYGPDTLPHGDKRRVKPGVTLAVEGDVVLCKNGLHSSVGPLDALQYGSGHFWRVAPGGTVVHGGDKLASSERTHLWRVKDTDDVLRHFARLCALDVVDDIKAPAEDKAVILRWLRTGDESIRLAAYSAAYSAADSAARLAAYSAARSTAYLAAYLAAYLVADSAAYLAAHSAAYLAAHSAPKARQSKRLHRMLMQAQRVTE